VRAGTIAKKKVRWAYLVLFVGKLPCRVRPVLCVCRVVWIVYVRALVFGHRPEPTGRAIKAFFRIRGFVSP